MKAFFWNGTRTWLVTAAFSLLSVVSVEAGKPPVIDGLFPAGADRGTTVRAQAIGSFDTWPQQFWSSIPDLSVTVSPEKRGELQIRVLPSAQPGIAWLRSHDSFGASALRPFAIGTIREDREIEPNDTPVGQPAIPHPHVLINGTLSKRGDVDCFLVPLDAGETLVADLQANSFLGSQIDAMLQVCRLYEHRGRLEAYVLEQNLDTVGLDPRLAFTAPEDGRYLVRVMAFPSEPGQDIAFTGSPASVYRLTLTTKSFVDFTLPLSHSATASTEVNLFGWNLPEPQRKVTIPGGNSPQPLLLSQFFPDVAGFAPLQTSSIPVTPYQQAGRPQAASTPSVLSGVLTARKEGDTFTFDARKGEILRFKVESRRFGFQTALALQVLDAGNKKLANAESRFAARDPELSWTSPADGKYLLQVTQPAGFENARSAYQLSITSSQPDFEASVAADRFTLQDDKPLEIPVTIDRRDGFAEDVSVEFEGLPEGVESQPMKSSAKDKTAKTVTLTLKTSAVTEGHSVPLRIIARTAGPKALTKTATFRPEIPLAAVQDTLWLTVAHQGTVAARPPKKKQTMQAGN